MRTFTEQTELLSCFREIDRGEVELPPLPLASSEEALAWESGIRAFALFEDHGKVRGLVFQRVNNAMPAVATMCTWCHRVRGNGQVTLLSVRVDDKRVIAQYLCRGLECLNGDRFTNTRDDDVGADDMRETLKPEVRRARTIERLRELATKRVF